MAAFEKFQQELAELEANGEEIDPSLQKVTKLYSKLADKSDEALLKKQELERQRRKKA